MTEQHTRVTVEVAPDPQVVGAYYVLDKAQGHLCRIDGDEQVQYDPAPPSGYLWFTSVEVSATVFTSDEDGDTHTAWRCTEAVEAFIASGASLWEGIEEEVDRALYGAR